MLIDEIWDGSAFEASLVKFENTTGTPIHAASASGSGEALADEYSLTVSGVAGGTGTVTVATDSPNNPYNGKVVNGVPLDSATPVYNIVPGVALTLKTGTANGNVGLALVGLFLGTFDTNAVGAGTPSAGIRHRVSNNGTSDVTAAKARLVTQAVQVRKTGQALGYISMFAENAIEKIVGGGSDRVTAYALSISGTAGAGSGKTANLSLDGVLFGADTIMDLTDGALVDGTGLEAVNPVHKYKIIDGPLDGLEFGLDPACVNGDVANVLIFNSRFVQIAPDVAGTAGTFAADDVDLTEAGETVGTITAGGFAYYWVRSVVPSGANAASNPHPMNVMLEGAETGDAEWFA